MALFPVAPNTRWRLAPSWKISNDHISGMGRPIDFIFDPVVGFSGTADRMDLLPVGPNPRWRLAAILEKFERPYLGNGSSDPLHVWFNGRVFEVAGSNGATSGGTKSKITAVSRFA